MEQKTYWNDGVKFGPSAGKASNEVDVCIIGGGIIGASMAVELKQNQPDLRVCLVERDEGPMGATTRNAGFACFGSLSEMANDIDLLGADVVFDLVQRRVNGLRALRSRCGDANISYEDTGGHEVFFDDHPSLLRIEEINSLLEPIFGGSAFQRRDDLIKTYGFQYNSYQLEEPGTNHGFRSVKALVRTEYEGMLHSGLLVHRLWTIAGGLGVDIIVSDVIGIHDVQSSEFNIGIQFKNKNSIVCNKVVVATNARINETLSLWQQHHMSHPLSNNVVSPARGQILVTSPITNLRFRGTFHYNQGFVYFRSIGNRVLLGGGRNLAFEEEQTLSMETTTRIQSYLENLLYNVILPRERISIEYRWAGTMAFSESKQPVVEEVSPNVFVAFGCNGMGVAIGSEVAKRTAELIC